MPRSRVGAVRRPTAIVIGLGLVAVVALWLLRPFFHGLAMLFWTAPVVWLPPLVVLAVAGVILRRSRRNWTTLEDLRRGVRPPVWLAAFPVVAFLLFVFGASVNGAL